MILSIIAAATMTAINNLQYIQKKMHASISLVLYISLILVQVLGLGNLSGFIVLLLLISL